MRQAAAVASGLTIVVLFLGGDLLTLAFFIALTVLSAVWLDAASTISGVRRASTFLPVALALAGGFAAEADWFGGWMPELLVFVALLAAALTAAVSSRSAGFARRWVEAIVLGAAAGVCLVIGSYLAYAVGLGVHAEEGSWSGEAGRSLKGFLIALGALGAIFGGACGLI